MKILEQTSTRLTFKDKSVLRYLPMCGAHIFKVTIIFGILAAPLTFFGLGLISVVFTHEHKATLACDRAQSSPPSCQIVRSRLLSREVISIPLSDLQSATVQGTGVPAPSRTGKSYFVWHIVLETKTGAIRLNTNSTLDKTKPEANAK